MGHLLVLLKFCLAPLVLLLLPLSNRCWLVKRAGTVIVSWFTFSLNLVLGTDFVLNISRFRSESRWAGVLFVGIVAAKNIYARFTAWRCMDFNGCAFTAICASSKLLLLLLNHLTSLRLLIFITVARWHHWWSGLIAPITLAL